MERENEVKMPAPITPLCGMLNELKSITVVVSQQQELLTTMLRDTYSAMLPDPEPVEAPLLRGEGNIPAALEQTNLIRATIRQNDKLIKALGEILCGGKADFPKAGGLGYVSSNGGMSLNGFGEGISLGVNGTKERI